MIVRNPKKVHYFPSLIRIILIKSKKLIFSAVNRFSISLFLFKIKNRIHFLRSLSLKAIERSFFMVLFFFIGCCFGSFFCVVAERMPKNKSFMFTHSQCTTCKHQLKCWDLIPIFSIIYKKFRCSYCNHRIPLICLFSEIGYGIIFIWLYFQPWSHTTYLLLLWLTMAFILSLTDIFYYLVEPRIFYLFSLLLWSYSAYLGKTLNYPLLFALLMIYFGLPFLFEKFGHGDYLLLISWGSLLPFLSFIYWLFFSSLFGLIGYFLIHYFFKKKMIELPFVPFLSLGFFWTLWLI